MAAAAVNSGAGKPADSVCDDHHTGPQRRRHGR